MSTQLVRRPARRHRANRSGDANPDTPDGRAVEFPIDAFSKHCLLEGVDELGYILQQDAAIAAYEAAHPAAINALA